MVTYLFYPRRQDDVALSFEAFECADDVAAFARAEAVLRAHRSAVLVGVWEGERMVGRVVAGDNEPTPSARALR